MRFYCFFVSQQKKKHTAGEKGNSQPWEEYLGPSGGDPSNPVMVEVAVFSLLPAPGKQDFPSLGRGFKA